MHAIFGFIPYHAINRVDDFYKRPAGHIDLCNIPVPVR